MDFVLSDISYSFANRTVFAVFDNQHLVPMLKPRRVPISWTQPPLQAAIQDALCTQNGTFLPPVFGLGLATTDVVVSDFL
jgi:hypothetical protein